MASLTFERPDMQKFRCLGMAYEAIRLGGNAACIVNAANEVVNLAFRQGECRFLQMAEVIEQTLNRVPHAQALDLEGYMACDAEARRVAREAVNKLKVSR
jgi:1-deoxy-D-xylulose-5-phosphate reductoisomerase